MHHVLSVCQSLSTKSNHTFWAWGKITASMPKTGTHHAGADTVLKDTKEFSKWTIRCILALQAGHSRSSDTLVQNFKIATPLTLITAAYASRAYEDLPHVWRFAPRAGKGCGAYNNEFGAQFQDAEYEFLIKHGASFTITDIREDVDIEKIFVKIVMNVE